MNFICKYKMPYAFAFVMLMAFSQGHAVGGLLGEGEGDCDDSSECKSGLSCVNVLTKRIESFHNKVHGHETCEKRKDKDDVGRLGEGKGDCDDSSECKSGLICVNEKTKEIETFDKKIDGSETCEVGDKQDNNNNNFDGPGVKVVGATNAYACGSVLGKGTLRIRVPKGAKKGDFLALFVQRTDAPIFRSERDLKSGGLPYKDRLDKSWKMEAICKMQQNGRPCTAKRKHNDLINAFFWKFHDGKKDSYSIDMPGHGKNKRMYTPEWAILVALRNVDKSSPIDATKVFSGDRTSKTVFPALEVVEGGYLLLSQAFDDAAKKSAFLAPDGTRILSFATGSKDKYGCKNDETGFLFGKEINYTDKGRKYTTKGRGASASKDITVQVSLRPKN